MFCIFPFQYNAKQYHRALFQSTKKRYKKRYMFHFFAWIYGVEKLLPHNSADWFEVENQ